MQPLTASELNFLAYPDETPFAERRHRAECSLPVRLYNNTYGMGRHLLGSSLFGVRRGERKNVHEHLPTFRGATIEYTGPELRQDDATVLLALLHRTRSGMVDDAVSFRPRELVESMHWHWHSDSVRHLRECIERMQSSLLRMTTDAAGRRTHLVGSFDWTPIRWTVRLDERIVELFAGGTTFLPRTERALLTDGLQTWLAGFLRAQSDETRFSISDLLRFSGSEAALKRFGEHLRETMPKLHAAGVVQGYRFGRGSLTVER